MYPSNISEIQTFQNEVLRNIVAAPRYVENRYIYKNLQINTVDQEIKK